MKIMMVKMMVIMRIPSKHADDLDVGFNYTSTISHLGGDQNKYV